MQEFSLLGFIEHLGKLGVEVVEAEHEAMERAAKIVEREAESEIGSYQDSNTGPFPAWAELADSTKDDRARLGFTENDPGERTGEMRDSIGHVVHTPLFGEAEAVVLSNDDDLVYFEVGTEKQPPRSVLGVAAYRNAEEVAEILGEGVAMALVGKGVHGGKMPV